MNHWTKKYERAIRFTRWTLAALLLLVVVAYWTIEFAS